MNRSLRPHNRGVALLEVLVSVTVLSVGLGAAMSGLRTGLRAQRLAEERAVALRLAERQWAALREGGVEALERSMEGRFDEPYEEFSWSVTTEPADDEQPFAVVRLDVRRGTGSQRHTVVSMPALLR